MAKYDFRKFLDRLNIKQGGGTIAAKDWDSKLNICIMQACDLKFNVDHDLVDPLSYLKSGETYSPTDQPNNVSPWLRSFCISLNDELHDTPRQELLKYVVPLTGCAGSRSLEEERQNKLKAWLTEKGFYQGEYAEYKEYPVEELGSSVGRMINQDKLDFSFFDQILNIEDPDPTHAPSEAVLVGESEY